MSPAAAAHEADVRVVAKGGAVQIGGQVAQRGLSFLFTIVAFHFLGRAGYGLYRQVAQVLTIGGQIGLSGFNYAAMRFVTLARADRDPAGVRGAIRFALTATAIASGAVMIAVAAASSVIADFFREPLVAPLLRIGAVYIPAFALLQTLRYCTQAYKTMVPSVVAGNIVQPGARFVLGVLALLAGLDVAGAVVTLVESTAIAAVAAAWLLARMISAEEAGARPRMRARSMIGFALPQAGASLLGVQTLGLGILVLGRYAGSAEVGLFAVALALQGPGTVFLGGIVNIWAPVVSDLHHRGEIARLDALYKTVNRWIATFSLPVFAALIIDPEIFTRFYGSDALAAAPLVAVLAAGNIVYTATGPTGYVLSMTGRPGVNFVNSIAAVIAYVTLGALIVPTHGALGMAFVDAIVTAGVNVARVVEARVLVGIQPFGRSFAKPLGATAVGAAILLAWQAIPSDAVLVDAGGIAVAAVGYVLALKAAGIDDEERIVLDRIRRRALRRGR